MVNRRRLIWVILVGVLAFSAFAFSRKPSAYVSGARSEPASSTISVGFTLKDISGQTVRLSDFEGKIVIVNYWATWCPPCLAEVPGLVSIYEKYKDKGVVVIGITLDESRESVLRFVEDYSVTYPILFSTRQVLRDYGNLRSIPTTFILDQKHKLVDRVRGYEHPSYFEQQIQRLLKKT